MSNDYVELNAGAGGDKIDTEFVSVEGVAVERQRIQIAGSAATEIARVQATAPDGTEQALVVRPIPSGTQSVSDGGGSLTVDGAVTANAGSGTFETLEAAASTGAVTSVSASASSVTLLAANANRRGAAIYNDSTASLYVRLEAADASTTAFTAKLNSGGYYELPFRYTGEIRGIWSSATGAARITELTA